ncbi:iron-containing alcohol dehydrogenase family protein [Terrilactibacillus laevilacticus]|nr:iron-containing alcohol dehydrogenase family protein [Terrilactibacillus laevilacticus]
MMWNYSQPVNIRFGNGRIKELGMIAKELGKENGIIVCGHHFKDSALVKTIKEQSNGMINHVYGDVMPNPSVKNVMECSDTIKQFNCDFVIALGGGSSMDCAKAAATICLTDDDITTYHGTGLPLPKEHLPLIAVPTTSGTGSEVTCVSVLTNYETGYKGPINSDNFYPSIALIDPELTMTMSPRVTACVGIDTLSHALEGYWSKGHQPICDAFAIHAAKLVFNYLYTAYKDPENLEAREKMCEASLIAGLAFTLPKTAASHACSFPLTNLFDIPHGEACGITLDYFARINEKAESGRLTELARNVGFSSVDEMADQIYKLKKDINLTVDLTEFHLTEDQIHELVKLSRHPNLYNNPVEVTDEMLYDMYRSFAGLDVKEKTLLK